MTMVRAAVQFAATARSEWLAQDQDARINYLGVGGKDGHRKRDMRVAVQVSHISLVRHFYSFLTSIICFLAVCMIATYFTLT